MFLLFAFMVTPLIQAKQNNWNTLPFFNQNGFNYIKATISGSNGPVEVDLLLDFGDYQSISLHQSIIDNTNISFMDAMVQFSDYNGQIHTAKTFVVSELAIAEESFTQVSGYELLIDPANPVPAKGTIGLGFFGKDSFVYDYQNKEIRKHRTDEVCNNSIQDGMLILEVFFGSSKGQFLVDTGSQSTLIDIEFAAQLDPSAKANHSLSYEGNMVIDNQFTAHSKPLVFELKIPGIDGILGLDFLATHPIYINGAKNCFSLLSTDV